jgi:hypothetical protein
MILLYIQIFESSNLPLLLRLLHYGLRSVAGAINYFAFGSLQSKARDLILQYLLLFWMDSLGFPFLGAYFASAPREGVSLLVTSLHCLKDAPLLRDRLL